MSETNADVALREGIKNKRRWVVKVGSAYLTNDGAGLDSQTVQNLAQQLHFLRQKGIEVVLVSSGSIAAGVSQLGLAQRPVKVAQLQAAAAVGQAALIRQYEDAFRPFQTNIAQVLLTHADISNRERYLNAKSTLLELLALNVMVVINENDTVATDEICFGDNDSLGALVANLINADLLVILTDQHGLYSSDPRSNPEAKLIHTADADDEALMAMATGGAAWGRGGMVTKLSAARIAGRSMASTLIANGREPDILSRLFNGELLGTLLQAGSRLASKKQWLAGQMRIAGSVVIDDGAEQVLRQAGRSLLPVGVTQVTGDFTRGALIQCLNTLGEEVARGLSNYSADEVSKIMGKPSTELFEVLGYGGEEELIHRDNLVIV